METIGHHTCKNDGGAEQVLKGAPFISTYKDEEEEEPNYPFLGTGYYYWDNNIDTAKWWGNTRIKKGYFIVESILNLPNKGFLDLVGNRYSMIWVKDMIEALEKKGYKRENWTIGSFIEALKKIREKTSENEVFPYVAIRAIDYSSKHKSNFSVSFAGGKQFTLIDPRMIICLLEKNDAILKSVKIVYASNI